MTKYNVAVVGAGIVGKKMVEILYERGFPLKSLTVLATSARTERISGRDIDVRPTEDAAFQNVDIAFFAGTEGEKGASRTFGWKAVESGSVVIDNGADYRMDPRVPLVIPEVNPAHLRSHRGFIANPNCSTIQMLVALAPLHRRFGLRQVIVSTYQAVSGTGRKAIDELQSQVEARVRGIAPETDVYPHPIAFNLFPHIGGLSAEFPGCFTEEAKMVLETRKMLDLPDLPVSATCVRVPVFNAHSEAVTARFDIDPDPDEVREILRNAPGVSVMDDPSQSRYPTPLQASGADDVFVGRIRRNTALSQAVDLWVVADNIRKGAALNAVQIAEELVRNKLVRVAPAV